MAGHISLSHPRHPRRGDWPAAGRYRPGGLKSNASVLVGSLYSDNDSRRDAGFTIFSIGVNTGALIGPILTGWGWQAGGFHLGFGLAAIGMAAGLTQYALTRKNLPASVHHGHPSPAPRSATSPWHWSVSWSLSVSCWQPVG